MSRRTRLLLATTTCTVLLAGCAAGSQQAPERVRAEPAAGFVSAAEAPPNCEQDNQPPYASVDPGSVGTAPGTWSGGSTMSKIREAGKLEVGVAGDVPLWGARNPVNGRFEGFDIDVLKRIAQELGLDPEKDLEYEVLNFAGRLPALREGKVQLVAHTMTMTCERWYGNEKINFSTEYYRAGQKVLVRADSEVRGIEDLENESVCAATGSTSLENIRDKVRVPVEVSDVGECLVRFQEGEATAITGDDTVLAGFASQDPYTKVVGEAITQVPYGIGVAPEDTEFTQFVNAVLEEMRSDGTLAALTKKYMAGTGELPAVPRAEYGRNLTGRD